MFFILLKPNIYVALACQCILTSLFNPTQFITLLELPKNSIWMNLLFYYHRACLISNHILNKPMMKLYKDPNMQAAIHELVDAYNPLFKHISCSMFNGFRSCIYIGLDRTKVSFDFLCIFLTTST